MPPAPGNSAPETGGADHPDIRQHLFHGAHDPGKVRGTVELRIHPDVREVEPGETPTVRERVVETGERLNGWIEVRSGMTAGRVVVADGAAYLVDGARITVRERAE